MGHPAGVEIENPTLTITPQGWFDDQMKAILEIYNQQQSYNPSDATNVVTIMLMYRIVD